MAIASARCAVCGQDAYRNKWGRMMLHTRIIQGDDIGARPQPEVCPGSDAGARP